MTNLILKYYHELVDFWSARVTKFNYTEYGNLIELENWWDLEKQFEILSFLFINSESDQEASFLSIF